MSGDGGLWRKTLVYLGLVEEPEEHDDLPERFDGSHPQHGAHDPQGQPRPVPAGAPGAGTSNVRPLRVPEPGSPHVRAVEGAQGRVAVVRVEQFEDVEQVGSRYRTGSAVVIDLRAVEHAVARRVLDFVSGMTYALSGRLRPAGDRAFLLAPQGVELSVEERRRLQELGYGGRA
ncbi:MAG TPA: cell division protein SepF [Nitriliruptorales bacterium]